MLNCGFHSHMHSVSCSSLTSPSLPPMTQHLMAFGQCTYNLYDTVWVLTAVLFRCSENINTGNNSLPQLLAAHPTFCYDTAGSRSI
jgi:hypothetical protein